MRGGNCLTVRQGDFNWVVFWLDIDDLGALRHEIPSGACIGNGPSFFLHPWVHVVTLEGHNFI